MKKKLIVLTLLILLLINGTLIASYAEKVKKGDYLITNNHLIEGYSDKISYYTSETVELKVHCREPFYSLEISRYGKDTAVLKRETHLPGQRQDFRPNASEAGAQWKTTYSFTVPDNWKNGMYAVKLADNKGNSSYITFVVKARKDDLRGNIAVLASTNTWQAYNDWGGVSFYNNTNEDADEGKSFGSGIVSMLRPNHYADPTLGNSHLAGAELHVLSWMESNGYPYKLVADYDFNKDSHLLDPFKILIINTHNEYWTQNMYDSLEKFLNRGGSVLYLSGNGIFWKAVINDKDQIEVRKDFKNHILDGTPGGYWAKELRRPESAALGVRFQNSDFSVPAPYQVLKADHWIFEGTGLKNGDLVGKTGLTKVRDSSGGASGWETDQVDKNSSPKNTVLLARGTNTKGKGADMVYFDHPGGGGVFSVGSITFGGSLAVDTDLSIMVNNVLKHFLANSK
ncbi:MAG: N,N-dimethylformamidase beta subunit [Candidatus Dichloromethanomonas elyunquensis]|nr:MAG: N,N-dimethylformamidase beta subunit [Candidatus Dichloromethanomonas elyunquensis]